MNNNNRNYKKLKLKFKKNGYFLWAWENVSHVEFNVFAPDVWAKWISCALDVPSVSKPFPIIPSGELAGALGCGAGMSGQCAHSPGHCGVKRTRPPGPLRLFLLTHTHTSNGLTSPRQTFHTSKRALSTWRHAASSSAGKSIRTSSRPSAPPRPRLKPARCRAAVKCPSAKNQRRTAKRARDREAGSIFVFKIHEA